MSHCAQCGLDLGLHEPLPGGHCPNCGRAPGAEPARASPPGPGALAGVAGRFLKTARDVILKPGAFFAAEGPALVREGGLSSALAFAVIIQWLASFFNFVWRSSLGMLLRNRIDDLARIMGDLMEGQQGMSVTVDDIRGRITEFLFGAGSVVLTPFTALLKLAVLALFVHAAVRFFTRESPDRPHSYGATLKVLSYASAPWILCAIPGFGLLLAWILGFVAAVAGLRETYRTTTGRAVLAVLFPEILFSVTVLTLLFVTLFLALNTMRLVF